jgi:hypothetical protein
MMLTVLLALWLAADPVDFEFFVRRVEPIFLKSRDGAGRCYNCHSLDSNKALFHLQPLGPNEKWSTEQSRRNFKNAVKLVEAGQPLKSRLLLHPLAENAGGDPFHAGGKFWKSKDDPDWRTLARWVRGEKLAKKP